MADYDPIDNPDPEVGRLALEASKAHAAEQERLRAAQLAERERTKADGAARLQEQLREKAVRKS